MSAVLADIPLEKTFPDTHYHMSESGVTDNHIYILIKAVARSFLKIRMHHLVKQYNETMLKHGRVRKRLSKLILFKNQ